jgi:predicted transcriptional regulator
MLTTKSLNLIESNVYTIMRDYVKKNKELDMNNLLPYLYSQLGQYHQANINDAVNTLIHNRFFINGSSLTQDEILMNPIRKAIYQFIQINPGSFNRLIRRRLRIGSNEFNWHIGMLEKFGLIKKIAFGRSFGYYENRSFMGHEFDLFLLQNEKTYQILNYLSQNKCASLSQIAKGVEMHYSTIQKHVDILTNRGLLKYSGTSKCPLVNINDALMQKLKKIINGAVFVEFAEN